VDKRWLELRGAISLEGLESGRYALDVEVTGADGSVVRRSTAIVVK